MTIGEFLQRAGELRLDAEVILAHLLQKDRSYLVAHVEEVIPEGAERMLAERQAGKPLAYILGGKEFYGRKFLVNENVLIPRPETEGVVEMVLERINKIELGKGEFVTVVDVGTGSGVIAATVDLEAKKPVGVVGLDISDKALEVAEQNCERLGARVKLMESDLLEVFDEKIEANGGLILVANLPYVDKNWDWLSPELQFEPDKALYAEDGGLQLVWDFLEQAKSKAENCWVILEADQSQHQRIRERAEEMGMEWVRSEGLGIEIRVGLYLL